MVQVLRFKNTQTLDGFVSDMGEMPSTWFKLSTITLNCLILDEHLDVRLRPPGLTGIWKISSDKIEAVAKTIQDAGIERLVEIFEGERYV